MSKITQERLFAVLLAGGLGYCLSENLKPLFTEGRLLGIWLIIGLGTMSGAICQSRKRLMMALATVVGVGLVFVASTPLQVVLGVALSTLVFLALAENLVALPAQELCLAAVLFSFILTTGSLFKWNDESGRLILQSVQGLRHVPFRGSFLNIIGPWAMIDCGLVVASLRFKNSAGFTRIFLSVLFALTGTLAVSLLLLESIPAILGTVAVAALLTQSGKGDIEFPRAKWWTWLAAAGVLCVTLYMGAEVRKGYSIDARPNQTIAFAPIGLGSYKNHSGPWTNPNLPIEALFGSLPIFLQSHGWNVKMLSKDWNSADLAGCNAAYFVNNTTPISAARQADLETYVRSGGRLIIAGDHTNIMGDRDGTNSLCQFTGIRLRFDSAIPGQDSPEWHKGQWVSPALQCADFSSRTVGISVGASLELTGEAEPLIVGVEGFADDGNLNNPPGFLGDMQYDPGERNGSMVLVASQQVGQGSVIVWGDTSSFQDGSIVNTYPLLDRIFRLKPAGSSASTLFLVAVVAALVVISGYAGALVRLGVSVGVFLILYVWAAIPLPHDPIKPRSTDVVFDTRFDPRYPAKYTDDEIDHFITIFDRHAQIILAADSIQTLPDKPRLIVLEAPQRAISVSDGNALIGYLRTGGRILLTAGRDSSSQVANFLAPLGLRIDTDPIGGPTGTAIVEPDLAKKVNASIAALPPNEGDPFTMWDSSEVQGQAEPVATTLGFPNVVRLKVGSGKLIVIGDSRFVTDKSLGRPFRINVADTLFIYELLSWLLD